MALAGQRIKALDFTPAVRAASTTSFLNVSTTPALGSPGVNVTFTAPSSGKAQVVISLSIAESGGATVAGILDYRVRENNSSGTIIYNVGSLERRLILFGNTQAQEGSRSSMITGLTPGGTYYVETLHSSYGTQVDIFARVLEVYPLPA